jgi:hypothetical protein
MLEDMSRKVVGYGLVVAIVAAYLALIHSPLRFAGDSPVYLCDAIDLATGRGFRDDHLPPGYPHVLATMTLMGVRSNAGIVILNLVSMCAGLLCTVAVLRRELDLSKRATGVICLLCSLSWMWVGLVTFPLTEMLYFALSSMVLVLLSQARNRPALQFLGYLCAAAILAAAAFFVRTIGAALFVALVFALLELPRIRNLMGHRWALAVFLMGVVAATCFAYTQRDRIASRWYAGALGYLSTARRLNTTHEIVWWRIAEIGELMQNASANAVFPTTATIPMDSISPSVLVTLQLRTTRFVFGAPAVVLILAGLWSRRHRLSPVDAYLAAYFGILFIWPYDDPRFFAPVLPLLFALAWLGLRSFNFEAGNLRRVATVYAVAFCVFGVVALADSLYVTYFDRLRPWGEISRYASATPEWMVAYDRYGGLRPDTDSPVNDSAGEEPAPKR